jgi:hypothetical protein
LLAGSRNARSSPIARRVDRFASQSEPKPLLRHIGRQRRQSGVARGLEQWFGEPIGNRRVEVALDRVSDLLQSRTAQYDPGEISQVSACAP